jgi:hypothetical protein
MMIDDKILLYIIFLETLYVLRLINIYALHLISTWMISYRIELYVFGAKTEAEFMNVQFC